MTSRRVAAAVILVTGLVGCTSGSSPDATRPAPSTPSASTPATASPSPGSPSPAASRRPVVTTSYPAPRPGDLPEPTIRDVDWVNTTREVGEAQQITFSSQAARYAGGRRPTTAYPTMVEVAFGSVWTPATDGVLRVDPTSLRPTAFVPTGPLVALASSGYASMYAVVETPGRGLGVAQWEAADKAASGTVHSFVLDDSRDAADSVCVHRCAVGFAELLWITRSYRDRPSDLVEISVINGTSRVVGTFGPPGTDLVVDRLRSDSTSDLWVGGSDGVLRHVHGDGRVTTLDVGGPIVDLDASLPDEIWLAVQRPDGRARPVLVDARTERVTKDASSVVADQIAVTPRGDSFVVWATSVKTATRSDVTRLGRAGGVHTTATADGEVRDVTEGPDGLVFAVSPATQELVRVSTGFND